ncbi:TonB-dependent receptor domain-containing protein [Flavivirga spongiicola]|uniref:TonB-dependent receptor n=1 Tax=Flavivirga spongiicola TaxID=421621 RepID=A0ABU7XW30_9FLAO|nr:TonB-dependent receptor [Flavivirga sp. MEBiC05379]MDO5979990.1 TonB-dependent receptor [Flavivirga sp. MEBiC05379]
MHFIKKRILVLLTLGFAFSAFGQSKIKGKIIDKDNGAILTNVLITNLDTKSTTVSNLSGTFETSEASIYSFKKEGYLEKVLELKKDSYYIIQLNINPSELNEVIINSNHIPKKLKKATTSISMIPLKAIELGNDINIAAILNRTPGVFMQSGALNTNRVTIRGIGSRNLFGTAKIRAYFKDIPLTTGSGETTIEDFELNTISRFEIIKGATSSIYGAGLGGTIHITPKNAFLNQSSINSRLSVGSFGLSKGTININHGTTTNSFRAVYSNTHSDGYRENNEYDRQTFTLNSNHYLNENNDLYFLASFVDLKAFIPSSINEETYLNNPKSAAFTWKQSQGFEDSKRGIFGLSWNHQYNNHTKQVTSIFTSFLDAYEPRPFNILKENTLAIGIRSRILGNYKLLDKTFNWTLGGELFRDTYKSGTFENLYRDFPNGTGSVEGNQLSNFREKRNYYNAFFETVYELSEKTTLSIGLNLNQTSYSLNDRFPVSENNPDQSGNFKFKHILSPKFGISHLLSKAVSLYSNISHGFSPITLNETLLPDGQINTNLKPETGWNFEIGTRGALINNRLQFNLAIYRLAIKNLLVSRRTTQDEFIGINAGSTQHDGLELSLNYEWLQTEALSINSFVNYTLNNFKFKEFIDGDNNFSGNDLTGVPSDVFNTGIHVESSFGIYGNINFQYVGDMPITDNNSLYSDSYSLTNFKIGYKTSLNKKLNLNIFLGINNIFDKAYASQVLINASGFNGNPPRYYYPGNPVNYYTGVHINYMF